MIWRRLQITIRLYAVCDFVLPLHDCYQEADHNGHGVPAAEHIWRTAVAHYNTVEIAFGDLMEQNPDAVAGRPYVDMLQLSR